MRIQFFFWVTCEIILFPVLLCAQIQVPDSLTIDDAIRFVIQNNPAVQNANQRVAAAQARVEQSRSGNYPFVGSLASYSRVGPIPSLSIPGRGTIEFFPANNYNVNLGAQQMLYDFGRRAVITDGAETDLDINSDKLEMQKSKLAYQTVRVFYTILYLKENVAVLDSQIYDLNQHLLIARKRVETGTAIEFDVLTTEVRVAGAKNDRMDAVNMFRKQEIQLHQLLGDTENKPVRLQGQFSLKPVFLSTDSLITAGLNQRLEFKKSRNSEMMAETQYHFASLGKAPVVNMNVSYGFKNGYFPDLNILKGNWVAGMSVQMPIFDGYSKKFKMEEAQANMQAAEEQTRETKNIIISQIQQAITDLSTNTEKLQNSELQVRQAEEALAMAKKQYEIGVISNLDLIDSETTLARARLNHLHALYDSALSQYELDEAVGEKIW